MLLLQMYCERTLDGGHWSLVWKHSFRQVSRSNLYKAKTFSSYRRPCTDLSDGWCNIPRKRLPGAKEQMIVAYHSGIVVYAYKSPLNPNLGKTALGPNLMPGWKKVVDKCRRNVNIRPAASFQSRTTAIYGLSFDKRSPTNPNWNCDTVYGNYHECRWYDCILPPSISRQERGTQQTIAIYVR